jgi:uncharacterized Zn finger protein
MIEIKMTCENCGASSIVLKGGILQCSCCGAIYEANNKPQIKGKVLSWSKCKLERRR